MKKTILQFILAVSYCIFIGSCGKTDDTDNTSPSGIELKTLATGFTIPWAIAVISEDEYLITERLGALFRYKNGTLTELSNLPPTKTISPGGLTIGGLMDVSLHPKFDSNRLVYIAYVAPDFKMKAARFELHGNEIHNLEVIFESNAFSIGSRFAWQDDNHFFLTHGVAGDPYPEPGAQDLKSDLGKIHRLMANGDIPEDNPVIEPNTEPTSIWSYGHRDPQGLYYDSAQQILYANEHGPLGGDELNIIEKGENYGWPLFSYGLNYDQTAVSDMTEAEAETISVLPAKYWSPDFNIAPSGLTLISDSQLTTFNGFFVMGALAKRSIVGYRFDSDKTEILLENIGRARDIAQLPSGNLLTVIDKGSPNNSDEGRLVLLTNSGE